MWYTKFRSYWDTLNNPPETGVTLTKPCEVPGCAERGDFRAPRSRDQLNKYYWFCLEHVREYNQNWDFFKGMSQSEIERSMSRTATWDRPTWRSTQAGYNEEKLRQRIYEKFTGGEDVFGDIGGESGEGSKAKVNVEAIPHPAIEALATMGLQPPVTWDDVRARYKTLAKRYHPDVTGDDKDAEERLKKINLSYSILKLSYQNFSKLDEK